MSQNIKILALGGQNDHLAELWRKYDTGKKNLAEKLAKFRKKLADFDHNLLATLEIHILQWPMRR